MVWLFPIWLSLFTIAIGCGLLVATLLARLGGAGFRAPLNTFQTFWLGYVFIILFLLPYSLVMPIRWPATVLLAALALVGFIQGRATVRRRLAAFRARPRLSLALALTAVVITVLAAAHAAQPVAWYDTLLYHQQVLKWARAYPAVPGIANLHFRLAYNNSIHLYAALCDTLWKGRGAHIPVGMLASVTTLQLLNYALRPARGCGRVLSAYSFLTLPFVAAGLASNEIASLSSDLPLNLLCIVIGLELLTLPGRPGARSDTRLALIVALAAVATTTKLGGAGMLVVSGALALWSLRRSAPAQVGPTWRRVALLSALPSLVLLGYFARQSVLSGWLLFPAPIGNLHLPWSLPEAETLDQFRWIQSWARIPRQEPSEVLDHGFLRWFAPWFRTFSGSAEYAVLAMTGAVGVYRLAQGTRHPACWHVPALAAAALSLLLWFRGAPDLRFGAGLFWLLLAVVAAPLLAQAMQQSAGRVLGLVLCLGLTHWTGGLALELPRRGYWINMPRIPGTNVHEVELAPGVRATMPSGDNDRCGDAPLPCTPVPAKQRMRDPSDLRYGYEY